MVLGIPVISSWVHAKTSALAFRRSCNLLLKCSGSCFLIVTVCSGYLLLMITFSSAVVQLKNPFSLAGGVFLTFFTPSLTNPIGGVEFVGHVNGGNYDSHSLHCSPPQ
ncbi:hypothetical protein Tco_0402958 [Tanacetum coccineum]